MVDRPKFEDRVEALEDKMDELLKSFKALAPVIKRNPSPALPAPGHDGAPAWWHTPPPWMQPAGSNASVELLRDVFLPLLLEQRKSTGPAGMLKLMVAMREVAVPPPAPPPPPPPELPSWMVLAENPLVQSVVAQRLGVKVEMVKAFSSLAETMEGVDADALENLVGEWLAGQTPDTNPGSAPGRTVSPGGNSGAAGGGEG